MRSAVYILSLALLFSTWSSAQSSASFPKGVYFEYSIHAGKPFKHRPYITVDFSNPSFGTELNLEFKTYGKKHWHQRCGFPRWGLALSYQHSGNEEKMGSGIGILPNISIDFFKKNNFRIFGRMAVGLSIITKPYHPTNNPENNVIGSYVNNNTAFRLGFAWRFHPNFELRPSATFTHYSNAATQLPNLGINIPTFQLGICYMPNPVEEKDYIYYDKENTPQRNKRIQFSVVTSFGFREMTALSGPKYPVIQTSLDAGLYINKSNRLKAGVEYDYIGAYYAFMLNHSSYSGDLHWKASRISLYIADEIMIGRFSILVQVGVYLTQNPLQPSFLAFRLSGRYYILDPYLNPSTPFITITMKAHQIVAEYVSVGFGTTF